MTILYPDRDHDDDDDDYDDDDAGTANGWRKQ
jgi:hypothetical protein